MTKKKEKLCFVLPEYAQATHFSYVAEFVEALVEDFDIFLITEKGNLPEKSKVVRRHRGVMRFAPFRVIEMFGALLWARVLGYRTQYVHYSFVAAIASGLITRVFGGRTLYWNCGMPWLYPRSWFQETYEHLAYHVIHHLVTGSSALVAGYATHYAIPKKKILIVPNWVDGKKSPVRIDKGERAHLCKELSIPTSSKVLLFVHRLAKRKGAHLLPDILERINDPHAFLVVVGDGPERDELLLRFKEKGLTKRVRMVGAIPQENVFDYFAVADVFLLPSEEEGFPHVLAEAMLCGAPFVASDVGGVRSMIPANLQQYVVPYGDVDQFSHHVNELLSDEISRREAGMILQTWVQRYDKRIVLQEFSQMLQGASQEASHL